MVRAEEARLTEQRLFLIIAESRRARGLYILHKYQQRSLEGLKQVRAKNLSQNSASLKKLRIPLL